MMHNQGAYLQQQGQQSGGPPMMMQQQQQQRSPQQQSQAHNSYIIPQQQQQAPAQQGPHQAPQFIPPYATMPQHVPANQLTQIPGMLFHQDTPFLMCIPMIFNARECTWACQNGVIVPPNTATTISGFHVIHQQPLQQQHQQMQNGYGPQISHQPPQQQHAPSTGSSGFGDNGNTATRASPSHAPSSNVPNAGMQGGTVIYGYPQQGLSHYPVMPQAAPGQFYGPPPPHGFHSSQQIQMNSQSVVYAQQSGHLIGSQATGPMPTDAGLPHGMVDGQTIATTSHPLDQGKSGLANGSPSQSSEAQSRSSSYSSTLDVEQAVGHDGHPSDSATPQDGTTFSRSTTPSPETVGDLTTIMDNNYLSIRGDDTDANYALSKGDTPLNASSVELGEIEPVHETDSIKSDIACAGSVADNTDLLNGQSETIKEHLHRASPGHQARKGTHSATSVASGNRSSNQSPSIAQASASPVNLVGKPSLPTDAATESQKRLTRESTSASVTPSPVPAQPIKSWAALVGQSGPKGTTSPAVSKPPGRSSLTPHSETIRENPVQMEPPMPSAKSGYPKEEYGRHLGQSSGQQRVYEFPKLKDEEADAYPDELQVYIRDIPVIITSDVISNAMRRFGELVDIRLRYHHGNRNLRFCFVLFTKREPADLLLEKGTVMINGVNLMVQNKKKKGPNLNYNIR